MNDLDIAQRLQQALGDDQIQLQVKQQDRRIMIMINRTAEAELDCDLLVDWFSAAVATIPGAHFQYLTLYSRILGEQKPDWQQQIPLQTVTATIVAPPPPPQDASVTVVTPLPSPQDASVSPATLVAPTPLPVVPKVDLDLADQSITTPIDPEEVDLSEYCFITNKLLVRTSLPAPKREVAQIVKFFHDLDTDRKREVLGLLNRFFKAPDHTALDQLAPDLHQWFQSMQDLNEQRFKDLTIWMSRYCANPSKTLNEIAEALPVEKPATVQGSQSSGAGRMAQTRTAQTMVASSGVSGDQEPSTGGEPAKEWMGAGRSTRVGVPLQIASFAGNLAMASGVTLMLLLGMILVLMLAMIAELSGQFNFLYLGISIGITILFSLIVFFLSPIIMDVIQAWLYSTHWVSLSQIERHSPESAAVIRRVCEKHNIPEPRLGIIYDQNPTAFTYGSLPSTARIVVSEGLFTYLNDDEAATVYAHELGHIVHWDFAIMTLASTLVQICYLIYAYLDDKQNEGGELAKRLGSLTIVAYVFYVVGTYLVLYLSRVREYFADHFAAEITGNPNGLSRALVKIAYGIVSAEENQPAQTSGGKRRPNRLLEGTRSLGIYDGKAAPSTATAYRVAAEPAQVGKVFLWDLFNPWAWWMELSSTHPLTGKRVRALSTYAEQLGIGAEFEMGKVAALGNSLNRKRLYQGFALDIILMNAPFIGVILGVIVGSTAALNMDGIQALTIPLGSVLLFYSIGRLIKTMVMFPNFKQAPATTVLNVMSDPYASPLRGVPIKLQGEVIGRGDAGSWFGSDLKLQDPTGLIFLHYASRFGSIGNFFFGATKVMKLLGRKSTAVGWFRRGVAPWVDLVELTPVGGEPVQSYHAFWQSILGVVGVIIGIGLLIY